MWGGKGSHLARNLLGGTGRLPEALGRELGERARTGCRVHAVESDGAELVVRHDGGEIRARHVIVAARPRTRRRSSRPSPRQPPPRSHSSATARSSASPSTSERGAMPYDDVYAMATPGRAFDMFTNQAHALRGGARRPGGSLMLFAGGHGAAALMRESDGRIAERFLADLHELYPQTRGVIAGATVQRWELGNVYARPGRGRLQGALDDALGSHENLHLAGDYFAELGNIEAAARTGHAAAEVDAESER